MPTPRHGESEAHFVSRCIPIVIADGTAQNREQASAICYDIYRSWKAKRAARTRKRRRRRPK